MRKLNVLTMVTMDGVMQAPGGPEEDTSNDFKYGGWVFPYSDDFSGGVMAEQMSKPFDLLLGRKTYEIFAAYWPNQDPSDLVAAPFNKATKYVVSHSNPRLTWDRSELITGDVVNQIKELTRSSGPDLHVYGSGNLVQTLIKNDLVNEFWLKIIPITLGTGKRLFADGTVPAAFTVSDTKVSPAGVIFTTLKRSGDVQTGSFATEKPSEQEVERREKAER